MGFGYYGQNGYGGGNGNGFFAKLRQRLASFFYGRNGTDAFNLFLLCLYLILCIIGIFVRSWIYSLVTLLVVAYLLFRTLSKNLPARQKENQVFLRIFGKVRGFLTLQKNRFRDRKTHVYRTCPKCKSTLRLPRAGGKRNAICPRCGNHFEVRS